MREIITEYLILLLAFFKDSVVCGWRGMSSILPILLFLTM